MVDHICDDIMINARKYRKDFLEHLFSKGMFFNHRVKQVWLVKDEYILGRGKYKDIFNGTFETEKQNSVYVGYKNSKILIPKSINRLKSYKELKKSFNFIRDVRDLGFNGFECDSTNLTIRKAENIIVKMQKLFE